jgi:F0F1-type ATP synthase membrane subunit c/vacuolar-type H+-ATPase subunit K
MLGYPLVSLPSFCASIRNGYAIGHGAGIYARQNSRVRGVTVSAMLLLTSVIG